ncbi:reverse transcriptase domain-containing protein [Tanacetum coccineum]
MSKFNKWLSTLLRNKEKLEEIAITTVNAECSAIILNKVPKKLEDPGKFLIPCALQELDRTNALADSGASINLFPYSIYKQLGLGALNPTRMTLELANRLVMHPMGIAEDVVVRVDGFTFLADFVVVNLPFSGSTTNHSDALPPSSSPVKTSEILEEFADELTLLKKDVHFQVYSNPLFRISDELVVTLNTIPVSDKVDVFQYRERYDEINVFQARKFASNFEEGPLVNMRNLNRMTLLWNFKFPVHKKMYQANPSLIIESLPYLPDRPLRIVNPFQE